MRLGKDRQTMIRIIGGAVGDGLPVIRSPLEQHRIRLDDGLVLADQSRYPILHGLGVKVQVVGREA